MSDPLGVTPAQGSLPSRSETIDGDLVTKGRVEEVLPKGVTCRRILVLSRSLWYIGDEGRGESVYFFGVGSLFFRGDTHHNVDSVLGSGGPRIGSREVRGETTVLDDSTGVSCVVRTNTEGDFHRTVSPGVRVLTLFSGPKNNWSTLVTSTDVGRILVSFERVGPSPSPVDTGTSRDTSEKDPRNVYN